jgi:hypothetical protein
LKRHSIFNTDAVGGAVMFAFGAFAAFEAAKLPFGSVHQPDSGFFPLSIAVLVVLCALAILVPALNPRHQDLNAGQRPSGEVAALVGGLLAYGLLLKSIGFLICTSTLVVVMLRFPGRLRWKLALGVGLPATFACYALFTRLSVPLPVGIAGF